MDVRRRVSSACLALALPCCGARTALRQCLDEGVEQRCTNACGDGARICVEGLWSECAVPDRSRSCTNACGAGTQACHDGTWLTCDVREDPPATRACSSMCGTGTETCTSGEWQGCTAPQPNPPTVRGRVRDFHRAYPDMELTVAGNMDDPGVVAPTLGADDKPVYVSAGATRTIGSKANFDRWYRDSDGFNESEPLSLPLRNDPGHAGQLVFDNRQFFPIDNRLFGNEGRSHNYDFTVEIATQFRYAGGERLAFASDDDLWVFVNRRLAVDLGGIHQIQSTTVSLDAMASALGLIVGQTFPIHAFYAERHATGAALEMTTTLTEMNVCP